MNCLLLLPTEIHDNSRAVLLGARAKRAFELHGLRVGASIRAAVLNSGLGRASVLESSAERVELDFNITEAPAPRTPYDLIVAVPRPQTVKKVIQLSTMFGISSLHFIRAERCEKSYLSSTALEAPQIEEQIILGLEQAVDCCAPRVLIHQKFRPFVEDVLPQLMEGQARRLYVADTRSSAGAQCLEAGDSGAVCAIGPEQGWNDFELQCFSSAGAQCISLGSRMLRVEVAATALLVRMGVCSRAIEGSSTHK